MVVVGVVLVALACAGVWFVTSSGDDDNTSDVAPNGPGAAIVTWTSAMADHDYEAACDAMATAAVEKLTATGATCPAELERLSPGGLYDRADETKVLDEEVDGNRARVTIAVPGSELPKQPMAATREDGAWKADPFSFGADVGAPASTGASANGANTAEAKSAACDAEFKIVQTAVEAYQATEGTYPPDAEALVGRYLEKVPENVTVRAGGVIEASGDCG